MSDPSRSDRDRRARSIEMEARVRATAYMASAYMDTPGNIITVETQFIDRLSRGYKFNNRWHRNEILYGKQMHNYHLNAIKTIIIHMHRVLCLCFVDSIPSR